MISSMEKVNFDSIIGKDDELRRQIEVAKKAARCNAPVMIYGETGTGKELFARAIHNFSGRKEYVFLGQNCSAIPASLFEGIFFGTQRGAYTGALTSDGIFQQANHGTILLDELNSMPLHLQSKLLRVIQDGCIRKIGGYVEEAVDVRIITAVNEDPELLVEKGLLRADLFYRLNVIRIDIPSLENHKDDIPEYVKYFIDKANRKHSKEIKGISDNAMKVLIERDYPGNIRQLEHLIESNVVLCDGEFITKLI